MYIFHDNAITTRQYNFILSYDVDAEITILSIRIPKCISPYSFVYDEKFVYLRTMAFINNLAEFNCIHLRDGNQCTDRPIQCIRLRALHQPHR